MSNILSLEIISENILYSKMLRLKIKKLIVQTKKTYIYIFCIKIRFLRRIVIACNLSNNCI